MGAPILGTLLVIGYTIAAEGGVLFPPMCGCEPTGLPPICASDFKTYDSECDMNCGRSPSNQLHVLYRGPCDPSIDKRVPVPFNPFPSYPYPNPLYPPFPYPEDEVLNVFPINPYNKDYPYVTPNPINNLYPFLLPFERRYVPDPAPVRYVPAPILVPSRQKPVPIPVPVPAPVPVPYIPVPQPQPLPAPYIPDPQPQPVPVPYIPDPQPQPVPAPYIPDPQPQPVSAPYIPDPQPQPLPVPVPVPVPYHGDTPQLIPVPHHRDTLIPVPHTLFDNPDNQNNVIPYPVPVNV